MTFTRQELFEYFAADYTSEQVESALNAIARYDKSVNPKGEQFPDDITEQLEGAFEIGEKVIAESPNLSITEARKIAVAAATEQHPDMDTRIFSEILYIVTERAIARAAQLRRLEDGIFDAATAQLDAEALDKMRDRNERLIRAYQLIGNDDDRINKILNEYGVNSQAQTQTMIESWEQAYNEPDDEEFDASAWLTELNTIQEDEPAKKPLSRTHSRQLVKHMFSSARKLAG
ncbi:hypothetical protein NIES4101_53960 [Calothrix sp. NIES-4101]|nr:hypothetical protein NIES4101_53960 [Calothrix sp. NIES-4101]